MPLSRLRQGQGGYFILDLFYEVFSDTCACVPYAILNCFCHSRYHCHHFYFYVICSPHQNLSET